MDNKGKQLQQLTSDSADNRRPSWHPSGRKILFESNRNGAQELFTINIKNRKEKKVAAPLKMGEWMFASFSPNGKHIAASVQISENNSHIILLNKRGKFIQKLVENDLRNYYPKWSSDDKEIVYFSRKDTDNKDDEIYRLNIETGALHKPSLTAMEQLMP